MSIINFAISLLIIVLAVNSSSLSNFVSEKVSQLQNGYKSLYEKEREKSTQLENRVNELEKQLSTTQKTTSIPTQNFEYTGEDVFNKVNEYRRSSNVGEISLDPNLCYLASFRLSQLLNLGKLDSHKGFIDFDPANKFKYEQVGEDLAYGYRTAKEVVDAWVKSPGHNLILKDPVNTIGCVAANRGFSVLIAGREK